MAHTRRPPQLTDTIVYYRGRASGLAPLLSTFRSLFFIGLCFGGYLAIGQGGRAAIKSISQSVSVAEALEAFESEDYSASLVSGIRIALLILAGLTVLGILWNWIGWNATRYIVTNERIQFEHGILAKRIKTIDLWRVRDILFRRSMIEAIFGIGSVVIVANDATSRVSAIGPVGGARRLFDDLMEARAIAIRERGVAAVES